MDVGETMTDPVEVADWLPSPWLIETVLATVVFHESVEDAPGMMNAGDAKKDSTPGDDDDDPHADPVGVMV